LGIERGERERERRRNTKSSHQGVIGRSEACEDEGDMLAGADDLPGSSKLIDDSLHLGEESVSGHL
jgi:hypothetical protein